MNNTSYRTNYARSKTGQLRNKRPYARRSPVQSESNPLETIMMQCIVCGIVLTLALVICIVKTPSTIALRENLSVAISSSISSENFTTSVSNSVKTLLGLGGGTAPTQDTNINPQAETVFSSQTNNSDVNFRIDEDILESLNNNQSLGNQQAGDNSEKKLVVPLD